MVEKDMIRERISQWVDLAEKNLRKPRGFGDDAQAMYFAIGVASRVHKWEEWEGRAKVELEKMEDAAILMRRFKILGFEPTCLAILVIMRFCKSIGDAMIYMTYIAWRASEKGFGKALNARDVLEILNLGMWTDSALDSIWDAQKVSISEFGTDNLIDLLRPEMLPKAV